MVNPARTDAPTRANAVAAALRALADRAVTERRGVRHLHSDVAPKISGDPQHDAAWLLRLVNSLDGIAVEQALSSAGWKVKPGPRQWGGAVVLRARAPKRAS